MAVPEASRDERVLHRRVVGRDVAALAALYDPSGAAVFAIALRATGDKVLAEDITQAVILDLWHRPDRYDPGRGPLRPQLAAVAHHAAVECARRQVDVCERRPRDSRVPLIVVPDPDDVVDVVVVAEKLSAALEVLPDLEGAPIRLAVNYGKTYRQVARELDIPESVVKARMRSGLRGLAQAMHSMEAA